MTRSDRGTNQTFSSVWDALEDNAAYTGNMRSRSDLMIAIQEAVRGWGVTQAVASRRLDITQPRLNELLRGRINNFSLDALFLLAGRAGLEVRVQIDRAA